MNELWERLRGGAYELGRVAPAFIAAILVLLAGYLLAKQIERWVDRVLKRWTSTRWPRRADSPRRWTEPGLTWTRSMRWASSCSGW